MTDASPRNVLLVNSIEKSFLDYAQAIILSENCTCVCANNDDPPWPGYIGKHYSNGRVLLVGQIHHARPPDLKPLYTDEIRALAKHAKRWAEGRSLLAADEEYLEAARAAYRSSIHVWALQTVWNGFKIILGREYLDLTWDEIAFTNLAKCYLPSKSDATKRVKAHEKAFPLARLVDILDPIAVFVATNNQRIDPFVPLRTLPNRLVRRYDNMHMTSNRELKATWLPSDAETYRHIKTAGITKV